MQSTIFDTPVLKLESLKTKFDTNVLSNSFIALLDNNYTEARILQQLHYWSYSQYGVVIDGIRWIYKPLQEWLSEALTGLTTWKLRVAIASLLEKGLIQREKLYVKHHELKHNNPYWHPKNQTYYYSVNYDKLQELMEQVENPETIENVRIVNSTTLSFVESKHTKCCELPQNNTKNTSIENISRDQSHPTLPCEREEKTNSHNQRKQDSSNRSLLKLQETDLVNPKVIEKEIKSGQVDENINQNISTSKLQVQEVVQVSAEIKPKTKTPKGTKQNRQDQAPWKDQGEFKRFYRALIQAVPIVANARSPQGLAQVIIRQLRSGIPHTYWDDFAAGLPIGTSTKPEWEIEPGVPYPMFIEYLTEKIKRGNNTQTQEQARNEVFRILDQPRQAKAFWGQFKRSVVNVSEQVERDRALGVSNPNTPVWTRERIEPSIEEAERAGKKLVAVNDTARTAISSAAHPQLEGQKESSSYSISSSGGTPPTLFRATSDPWNEESKPQPTMREMLATRGVKGFAKAMPKVSRAEAEAESKAESEALKRQQMNYKTHLNQMSVDEINELVQDPIIRVQLTPQLINSNYELILDYLGQIIGVKLSEMQIRERRSQSIEE